MWSSLRHQNVLPLLGVMITENSFAMVSEWMVNGNVNEFVRVCPDANRFELVGLKPPCPNLLMTDFYSWQKSLAD